MSTVEKCLSGARGQAHRFQHGAATPLDCRQPGGGLSHAAAIAPLDGSIQELPGHSDARTTELSTYVAKVMRREIGSPLDDL
jgi:integrase